MPKPRRTATPQLSFTFDAPTVVTLNLTAPATVTVTPLVDRMTDRELVDAYGMVGTDGTVRTPPAVATATTGRYLVTCADDVIRHAPFDTLAAAKQWAEWGHTCLRRHAFSDLAAVAADGAEPLTPTAPLVIRTGTKRTHALVITTAAGPKVVGYTDAPTSPASRARAQRKCGRWFPVTDGRVTIPAE